MTTSNQIKINNKVVTSFIELKNELHGDGQDSGTLIGNILIDDEKFFVKKHWSYSGGFPVFSDEKINNQVGKIVLDNDKSYCEGKNQDLYDYRGQIKGDAEIEFIKN